MSVLTEARPYTPIKEWTPEGPKFSALQLHLSESLEALNYSPDNISLQQSVAQKLALASRCFISYSIGMSDADIYRAKYAAQEDNGNCMAHSEATQRILEAFGLEGEIVWSTSIRHASNIWITKNTIWDIDSYHGFATIWLENHPEINYAHAIVRESLEDGNGIYLMTKQDTKTNDFPAISYQQAPLLLSESCDPFENTPGEKCLILPSDQGIEFFGAMGDLARFSSKASYSEADIRQYLPKLGRLANSSLELTTV